jgi:hypothetical protein
MREHHLSGRERLTAERAGVAGQQLQRDALFPEVTFQVRDHTDGVDWADRPERESGEPGFGVRDSRQKGRCGQSCPRHDGMAACNEHAFLLIVYFLF